MDKLYIVIPAYNEENVIKKTLEQWYPILSYGNHESRLVIADSQSTDNTHQILLELQQEYPNLVVLSESERQHGPKVIYLYDYAIQNNASWIFQTDADGQTNPDDFLTFWNQRNQYDAILGNRKKREDGFLRIMIEKVVCLLLQLFFGVKVPDANAPFRLMKGELLKKYLHRIPKEYAIPNIILTGFFAFYHEKMCFHEISFTERKEGKSSVKISKTIALGFQTIKDFKKFKKEMDY